MRQLRSGNILVLLFMLSCFQSWSQEVINSVTIEKINTDLFKVQYKLNASTDYDVSNVVLKIFRKRGGTVEEIFSKNISSEASTIQNPRVYTYDWRPDKELIKAGDELQAKIVLSLKPSLAKQKTKNKAPFADAGNSTEVELPISKPIALNGSKSYDEDGKIVSVQWKQITGPTNLTISKKDSLVAFTSGDFKEGTYAFELSVTDDEGATAISRTVLRVRSQAFIVNANPATDLIKKDSAVIRPVETVKVVTKLKGGPSNAAINLLLPGVGHYFVSGNYNGKNRKASSFIITAVYAGSVGGAFYFRGKSNDEYKKYNELASYREYLKDANGVIIGVRGGNEADANQFFTSSKTAHRNSLICLEVGGGILVTDFIYTLIKGSRNQREWKKEFTSLQPKLFISSNHSGTTAGIQIKF